MRSIGLIVQSDPSSSEDDELTQGEREYMRSGGTSAKRLLEENSLGVDSKGSIAHKTADGRTLEIGDLVQLRSGGPAMTVCVTRSFWNANVGCKYFKGDDLQEVALDPRLLTWIKGNRPPRLRKGGPA